MPKYRELLAWQASHELAVEVYRATAGWSASERLGLVAQLRRAAFSAAANIVEGSARRGSREFRRFLDIALGSLAEVEYGVEFAATVGVAKPADQERLSPLITRAGQLTCRLAMSMSRARRSQTRRAAESPSRPPA